MALPADAPHPIDQTSSAAKVEEVLTAKSPSARVQPTRVHRFRGKSAALSTGAPHSAAQIRSGAFKAEAKPIFMVDWPDPLPQAAMPANGHRAGDRVP
jgi:hypothetical protein